MQNYETHTVKPTWSVQYYHKNIEDKVDDKYNPITIEIICDKFSDKCKKMNLKSEK